MDNAQEFFNQMITESLTDNERVRAGIFDAFERTVRDCGMISDKDRILVPVANSADSVLLALLIREFRAHNEIDFDPVFVSEKDISIPSASRFTADYASFLGVPTPEETGIPAVVSAARERGCNKAALSDHYSCAAITVPKETVPGEPALQLIRPMRLIRGEDIGYWNSLTGLNLPFTG